MTASATLVKSESQEIKGRFRLWIDTFDQLTGDTGTAAVVPEKLQLVSLKAEDEAAVSNKSPFRLDEHRNITELQ